MKARNFWLYNLLQKAAQLWTTLLLFYSCLTAALRRSNRVFKKRSPYNIVAPTPKVVKKVIKKKSISTTKVIATKVNPKTVGAAKKVQPTGQVA